MLFPVTAVLLFVGLANAGSVQQSNQYVDTLLFNILPSQVKGSGQDPAPLPDFHTEFKDKVAFITVNVKTDYKKGILTGLSKMVRARDCSAAALFAGEYRINCTLAMDNLTLDYHGTTKYGKIPSVDFRVKANIGKLYVAIEFSSYNRGVNPIVRTYQVTNAVEFKPEFTGLGPASSILKGLTNTFTREASNRIVVLINGMLGTTFTRAIANTVIPI